MHHNEKKYDQLFRNRLRDLSHPVRSELWSRIQGAIRGPKPSVRRQPLRKFWPTYAQKLSLLRSAVPSNVLTVATAAIVITLGIIHYTHTSTPPSAQRANQYSTIKPAIKPAGSPGESSVTPRGSSRDHLSESATPKNIPATRVPAAPDVPGTTSTKPNSYPENTATAVIRKKHLAHRDHITTARHHHISADPDAHGMSAATETTPGGISAPLSVHRHNRNSVTLPAMAPTSIRAAIAAGAPGLKSGHNGSNTPAKTPHFHRTGYVSLYASPDFPNHNYTWSYTLGFRATLQFNPHWSFTAGLEYARVNVPTQVIPPIGYGDTLHSFYFSNYEVPILFGYTRTFRHSTLTVNGGAILNLYFHRSTGVWVFNLPDRDSYGAVLGVEYTRPLSRHLAIFAQPYARYSISDYRMFTQPQRWSFGTLLGVKYQL